MARIPVTWRLKRTTVQTVNRCNISYQKYRQIFIVVVSPKTVFVPDGSDCGPKLSLENFARIEMVAVEAHAKTTTQALRENLDKGI